MALLLLRLIAWGCITLARAPLFAVVCRLPLRSYVATANVEPHFIVGWGWVRVWLGGAGQCWETSEEFVQNFKGIHVWVHMPS